MLKLLSEQWAVTTNPDLFNVSGNHINEGDQYQQNADIDIEKVSGSITCLPLFTTSKNQLTQQVDAGEDGVADIDTAA